jgi:hypothetical protein
MISEMIGLIQLIQQFQTALDSCRLVGILHDQLFFERRVYEGLLTVTASMKPLHNIWR